MSGLVNYDNDEVAKLLSLGSHNNKHVCTFLDIPMCIKLLQKRSFIYIVLSKQNENKNSDWVN